MFIQQTIKKMKFLLSYRVRLSLFTGLITLGIANGAQAIPSQEPIFLSSSAKPHINLVMSVDNELFKKAYNDYSNLSGGNLTTNDTTYRNDFSYYGYFDPDWCYTYSANSTTTSLSYFTPAAAATVHKCATGNQYWSGNFLNWATMTRVDILRRVLYGGKRSVDSTTQTVLERAYLPRDIHAFVKVYTGGDMNELTPYTYNASTQPAISLCNVSTAVAGYPVIRVANGNWRQWSASESRQCEYASSAGSSPTSTSALAELVAKVEVCVASKDVTTSTRCKTYPSSSLKKPFGLLQTYGEKGSIKFSLVTGSYLANTKGGVLRREASLIAGNSDSNNDEIDLTTGVFRSGVSGIIKNIDSFKIASYSFSNTYTDCNTHSITVDTVKTNTTNSQRCSDWGNPLAEIYLEALRYIAGNTSASTGFNVDDTSTTTTGTTTNFPGVPGLTQSLWGSSMTDPWPVTEWCAKCFSIILSTGANSFDADNLGSVTNLPGLNPATNLDTLTNSIGTQEYPSFATSSFFSGGVTNGQRYCKPTTLAGLSNFRGICPEQPATEGSYQIAGLAYYARISDLRTGAGYTGLQNVNTYAIDLAESLPSFKVPIGGVNVEFLPACEAKPGSGNYQTCSLIDVIVENIQYNGAGNLVSGSFLFFWEDSLWGNDYDFDGAQRIAFCVGSACGGTSVGANQIKIVNSVPYAYAGNTLHFSYNIAGVGPVVTTKVISKQSATPPVSTDSNLSDFAGGILTPWADRPGGQNFSTLKTPADNIPDTVTRVESTFTASSTTSAILLKKPLYYVAKYGGFTDSNNNQRPDLVSEWDNKNGVADTVPDNYFSVKNPADLEDSLIAIFDSILSGLATASAVATSSTRLQENTYMYQAQFDASDWSGALYAYEFDANGLLKSTPSHCTKTVAAADGSSACVGVMPTSSAGRNIYTYNGTSAVSFTWANLTSAQQAALQRAGETTTANAQARVNWIRGDATGEGTLFRSRGTGTARNILGDIVNSSPAYAGSTDYHYSKLPGAAGSTYRAYVETKKTFVATNKATIFVGANDGMLHAFNAETLQEKFAYIPKIAFSKLANLTNPDYGQNASTNPHQFVVDGPITVGDAYISGAWKTIIVGTLGAGGRGVYALDVSGTTPQVLFELDSSNYSSMGYVMGKPLIVPMKNGRFAAVFGNGDSSGTSSRLFVVDLQSPTSSNTRVINTGAGTGLSAPALLPNGTGQIESAYAGDLGGNIWKFDLSSTSSGSWNSAYRLFAAKDASNNVQPITSAPTLGLNASKNNAIMVYVGTGKYYDSGDNSTSAVPRHSFYAIADVGATVLKSSLLQKTMTTTTTTPPVRTVSTANPDWTTQNGWYLDFDANGERVTTKTLLIQDKLIFPTLIPTGSPCDHGGKSWVMEIPAVGDKFVNSTVLDGNIYNEFLVLGDLAFGQRPNPGEASILGTGSNATPVEIEAATEPTTDGRQSWRQVR